MISIICKRYLNQKGQCNVMTGATTENSCGIYFYISDGAL